MEPGDIVRVLLVDDHAMVRDGLKKLIESQPDLLVVGEAGSEAEAEAVVSEVSADVALVDVSLPGRGGVKLTEAILSIAPGLRVIAVTRHNDQAFVTGMLRAGAWGYVLKQSASSGLLRAVRTVAAGQRFIDQALRPDDDAGSTEGHTRRTGEPVLLAPQEEQVLRLVAAAYSNQEIAGRLGIALSDIVALKSSSMEKAGVISRLQVMAYARSQGWE